RPVQSLLLVPNTQEHLSVTITVQSASNEIGLGSNLNVVALHAFNTKVVNRRLLQETTRHNTNVHKSRTLKEESHVFARTTILAYHLLLVFSIDAQIR